MCFSDVIGVGFALLRTSSRRIYLTTWMYMGEWRCSVTYS